MAVFHRWVIPNFEELEGELESESFTFPLLAMYGSYRLQLIKNKTHTKLKLCKNGGTIDDIGLKCSLAIGSNRIESCATPVDKFPTNLKTIRPNELPQETWNDDGQSDGSLAVSVTLSLPSVIVENVVKNMSKFLFAIHQEEEFADITLLLLDGERKCNRLLMSLLSKPLRGKITEDGLLDLRDAGATIKSFDLFMNMALSGTEKQLSDIKVGNTPALLLDVYKVARELDVKSVEISSLSAILDILHSSNVVDIVIVAFKYGCELMMERCLDIINNCRKNNIRIPNWNRLSNHNDVFFQVSSRLLWLPQDKVPDMSSPKPQSNFGWILVLRDSLLAQYRARIDTDFTIKLSNGKEMFAHKCILCERSPIMKQQLANSSDSVIYINDFDESTVDRLLLHCYIGEYHHDAMSADVSLLQLASLYRMDRLAVVVSDRISSDVTNENISQIVPLLRSDSLSREQYNILLDGCIKVIKESKTSEIIDFGQVMKIEKLFQAFTAQYDEFIQHARDDCAHDRESNDYGAVGNIARVPTGSEAVSECVDPEVLTTINPQNLHQELNELKQINERRWKLWVLNELN